MMVETMLESQDFGMSSALSLPQWKRELLQRRATRVRVCAPPPPPPPPPAPDTEELRYGPGIVKRLQSRYLSLALRDARRRPDLRRAASLDHLAAAPPAAGPSPASGPGPAPPPAALPAPACAFPAPSRREYVKRARSVDALSRAEGASPPPPAAPRAAVPRAARPPRRPQPAVPVAERPPPDRVRTALRKFEPTAARRAPAARVAAVVRGLEGGGGDAAAAESAKRVSRAALDGIARAGLSVQYSYGREAAGAGAVPVSATNPVLAARARTERGERRVGVIRPLPPAPPPREPSPPLKQKEPTPPPRIVTPPPPPTSPPPTSPFSEKASPILARVELLLREASASPDRHTRLSESPERPPPSPEREPLPVASPVLAAKMEIEGCLVNGHGEETPERNGDVLDRKTAVVKEEERKVNGAVCTISEAKASVGAAGARRERGAAEERPAGVWGRGAGGPGPAPATSVVFDFSRRAAAVPDYVENDGVVRRAARPRYKAGEPGVVVLAGRARRSPPSSEDEGAGAGEGGRAPSPCAVRFLNDNVLINGRGCLAGDRARRHAKLKLQFDESLTQTHEYPSESSLCEEDAAACPPRAASPASPASCASLACRAPPASPVAPAHTFSTALPDNSHLGCVSLARYTPSKSGGAAFELGVTRLQHRGAHGHSLGSTENGIENGTENGALENGVEETGDGGVGVGAQCSWSEARALRTDLLF